MNTKPRSLFRNGVQWTIHSYPHLIFRVVLYVTPQTIWEIRPTTKLTGATIGAFSAALCSQFYCLKCWILTSCMNSLINSPKSPIEIVERNWSVLPSLLWSQSSIWLSFTMKRPCVKPFLIRRQNRFLSVFDVPWWTTNLLVSIRVKSVASNSVCCG